MTFTGHQNNERVIFDTFQCDNNTPTTPFRTSTSSRGEELKDSTFYPSLIRSSKKQQSRDDHLAFVPDKVRNLNSVPYYSGTQETLLRSPTKDENEFRRELDKKMKEATEADDGLPSAFRVIQQPRSRLDRKYKSSSSSSDDTSAISSSNSTNITTEVITNCSNQFNHMIQNSPSDDDNRKKLPSSESANLLSKSKKRPTNFREVQYRHCYWHYHNPSSSLPMESDRGRDVMNSGRGVSNGSIENERNEQTSWRNNGVIHHSDKQKFSLTTDKNVVHVDDESSSFGDEETDFRNEKCHSRGFRWYFRWCLCTCCCKTGNTMDLKGDNLNARDDIENYDDTYMCDEESDQRSINTSDFDNMEAYPERGSESDVDDRIVKLSWKRRVQEQLFKVALCCITCFGPV